MKNPKEKILGILGGMGPYATLDFIKHIYDNTSDISVDSDHIRVVTDINVKLPSRTRAILFNEQSPVDGMVSSIKKLSELGASVIAVPCNSAHYFYNSVKLETNYNWINMLECVSDAVKARNSKRPLILGGYVTVSKKIYKDFLPDAVYLEDSLNEVSYELIEEIKISSNNYLEKIKKIIDLYKKSGADSILLACTEFTVIKSFFMDEGIDTIDSNEEYAKHLIKIIKNKIV